MIRARADEWRQSLQEERKDNAARQARHRVKNPEQVREAEKCRTAKRRAAEKAAREQAPFIAIDAEGCDIGQPFEFGAEDASQALDLGLPERSSKAGTLSCQDHRTFLWGACGDGGNPVWLDEQDKRSLSSTAICNWLVSLSAKFPHAIFVMFAAGYDWTQIFRDMSYEKAWELWNGLPWSERDTPTGMKPNRRRVVFWHEFGLRLYPGKYLEILKFRDPNNIKSAKGEFDFESKIKIYDTFGFFQSSFLKAARGFGGEILRQDEDEILESGKSRRNEFAKLPLGEIMRYTAVELRVLARMMTKLREGLKASELVLKDWHGAGCIAQIMIRNNGITEFYPDLSATIDVNDLADPLAWALRAYFGGRVEMIKQGAHNPKFWNYDISSAYPHILRQLPNMRNGDWCIHSAADLLTAHTESDAPNGDSELFQCSAVIGAATMSRFVRSPAELQKLLDAISSFSLVSMVRIRFHFPDCHRRIKQAGQWIKAKSPIPWFPLSICANDGAIYFPRYGEGIYMVEEARSMLRWAMRIYADAEPDELPAMAFLEAREFLPTNGAKPFKNLVEKCFDERAKIVEENKAKRKVWENSGKLGPEPYDVREKVLKLGLNSIYGKTAQSKGGRIKRDASGDMRSFPPREANPHYAAAVTAGARAMLIEAAADDPDAVILFATDGVCSIRDLPSVEDSETKKLGTWERAYRQDGVFVKAGIYSHAPYEPGPKPGGLRRPHAKRSTKMRGIRPSSLPPGMTAEQWLIDEVPDAWAHDAEALQFPYRAYKTFGAALASREAWKLAGHWIEGMREADIQRISQKRDCRGLSRSFRSTVMCSLGKSVVPYHCSTRLPRKTQSAGSCRDLTARNGSMASWQSGRKPTRSRRRSNAKAASASSGTDR